MTSNGYNISAELTSPIEGQPKLGVSFCANTGTDNELIVNTLLRLKRIDLLPSVYGRLIHQLPKPCESAQAIRVHSSQGHSLTIKSFKRSSPADRLSTYFVIPCVFTKGLLMNSTQHFIDCYPNELTDLAQQLVRPVRTIPLHCLSNITIEGAKYLVGSSQPIEARNGLAYFAVKLFTAGSSPASQPAAKQLRPYALSTNLLAHFNFN